MRLPVVVAAVAVGAGSLVAGVVVGSGGEDEARPVPEASGGGPVERVSFLAKLIPPEEDRARALGPSVPRSIEDLARRLPLEQKIAQLFLVGFRGRTLTADVFTRLRRLDYGGIVIERQNYADPQLLGQLAGEASVVARERKHVPPLVMAPQEGGRLNAFPDLPPAEVPADLGSARAAGTGAAEAARTLKPLGITGVLAPVIDVGLADDPALGERVYSDDPAEVAAYADAVVRAYRRARMLSAVGHFPGLGTASQPTDEAPATVGLSLGALRDRDLVPFRAAFRAGAPMVVLSHALYAINDYTVPASLSRKLATDLLRAELGFRGIAVTDDLADPAITAERSVAEAAVRAIRAGADMVWISGAASDQQAAYVALLRAARRRRISAERLNEALLRILVFKRAYGLIR
jgi:beta-N-acetylhexosaminidase